MKTIDLKAFRKSIKFTQDQLGEYLGCKKAFISAMECGNRPVPEEMYCKLIDNPYGWDTSILKNTANTIQVENSREALLREFLAQKEQEVNELRKRVWELETLLKSKGGAAPGADSSSSVNVG